MKISCVALNCLTNFSFLQGASHAEQLVARAAELGYSAIAVTDECSMSGMVRAHIAARECGLKLIVGAEFALHDAPGVERLLLLAEPQALVTLDGAPQHHGPLSLVAGPERIESGWWDGRPVTRDYYVARNPQGEICWVFRDYRQQRRWYLHGYFA